MSLARLGQPGSGCPGYLSGLWMVPHGVFVKSLQRRQQEAGDAGPCTAVDAEVELDAWGLRLLELRGVWVISWCLTIDGAGINNGEMYNKLETRR